MEGWATDGYGEAFADVYDDWYGAISDVEATVACLVRHAIRRRAFQHAQRRLRATVQRLCRAGRGTLTRVREPRTGPLDR